MKKSHSRSIESAKNIVGLNALYNAFSVQIARSFINQSHLNLFQYIFKILLKKSKYLRRKIMHIVDNCFEELDIYNLQAIEALERAGIMEPTDKQINAIESLLKAA